MLIDKNAIFVKLALDFLLDNIIVERVERSSVTIAAHLEMLPVIGYANDVRPILQIPTLDLRISMSHSNINGQCFYLFDTLLTIDFVNLNKTYVST